MKTSPVIPVSHFNNQAGVPDLSFGPRLADISKLSADAMIELADCARLAAPLARLEPIPYRPIPLRRRQ